MLAARIGITPEEYYEMTPFELSCCADAFNIRQDELRQEMILQSYMTAALARAEKMPSLESLLSTNGACEKKPELTEEDLIAEVRRMNRAVGGAEIGPDS